MLRGLMQGSRAFRHEGELLPNPLALFDMSAGPCADILPCLRGSAHGDLHLRNIMVRGSLLSRNLAYWLIDVHWSTPAPLLYDHAYLEAAALLDGLRRSGSGLRVLPLLARLDEEQLIIHAELRNEDVGVVQLIGKIRKATVDTLRELQPRREDVWQRQLLFARIAGGLNWAGKADLDRVSRQAALLSACWATRLLVRRYSQDLWLQLAQEDSSTKDITAAQLAPTDALRAWEPFQSGTGGNTDLFLIADEMVRHERLAALGACHWAAVIDLDPQSDKTGLSSVVEPVLHELRHVSVFGENAEVTPPEVATNWLMANGWASHGEIAATSADDWRRRGYLPRVRRLIDRVRDETPRTRAAVLCLRSGKHDAEIDRVIDYIDERYGGIDAQLELVQPSASEGIDLAWFLGIVGESRPAMSSFIPSLPGIDGQWRVRWADLYRLSVDLEVLHSEVLSQSRDGLLMSDEFWRGRPPTWGELDAGVDIPRAIFTSLHADLLKRLEDHQLAVIHLAHSPGAGGTTLARRIAWSLHRRFPTVLLRVYSPGTIERVDEIYQETGLPVLMIAESADLPESELDELRQGLLQRNSRAVILWVNRTTAQAAPRRAGSQLYTLLDPLSDTERGWFLTEYRRRAETSQARELLDELAAGSPTVVPPQRLSPFYFGLCVYDAQFVGVTDYVRNHLLNLSAAQLPVARYLALITRYGQQLGLPVDFTQHLLGTDRPMFEALTDEQLRDTLGPDLRHLVVQRDSSLRLLHPLIAGEVLNAGIGGAHPSLGQIAVDFIKRVTEYFGSNNSTTERLLVTLFIRRNWSVERNAPDNFSDLILAMSTQEAEYVFEALTTACPDNPHFWNHRGRYHIYRVRGDYARAEQYLLTAVEKSHGGDGIHQHTLGMVRRFWIEDQLDQIVRRADRPTPEEALTEIQPLFDKAMDAFRDAARSPGQQSEHVWATPIQLIAYIVERLVQLSGQRNLPDFMAQRHASSAWVTEQFAVAEELLDNLRNGDEQSSYLQRLTNQLQTLYGNLDQLVEQWKELQASGTQDPEISRALARALFAKSGRDWTELTEERLREIAEMAGDAVRDGKASDSDLRLWFQAYRRLPEYLETYAIERLSWYFVNRQSLDAAYYLYVLHYIKWDRGDTRSTDEIRYYLDECRRFGRVQRRQWSFEWLGIDGRSHPLVHFSELGTQRFTPTGFWSRPQQLRRVTGIIEEIQSPQSGKVRILESNLTAFFTPRNQFRQTRDINKAIDFYLGFSYEGLRAWEPTYQGQVPDALRFAELERETSQSRAFRPVPQSTSTAAPTESPEPTVPGAASATADPPKDAPAVVPTPPKPRRRQVSPLVVPARRPDAGDDYQGFILALLRDAKEHGEVLRSLELGEALQMQFGPENYKRFRKDGLRKAVEQLGFRTVPTSAGFNVELP